VFILSPGGDPREAAILMRLPVFAKSFVADFL